MPAVKDFEDLANLSDDEMKALLREVDQEDAIIALNWGGEAVTEKMLGAMSERVRTFILEEMEKLGDIPPGEVEEIQKRIVDIAQKI